jgi:hypothetical protein
MAYVNSSNLIHDDSNQADESGSGRMSKEEEDEMDADLFETQKAENEAKYMEEGELLATDVRLERIGHQRR